MMALVAWKVEAPRSPAETGFPLRSNKLQGISPVRNSVYFFESLATPAAGSALSAVVTPDYYGEVGSLRQASGNALAVVVQTKSGITAHGSGPPGYEIPSLFA